MTVCYRHPDRATALRCTRCGRYICGDCMRDAAVGQHCVDCAQEGAAQRRTRPLVRGASGAPVVSYGLIALNVLAFIGQMSSAQLDSELVLWSPAVADGQIYRLLTSAFLHYGAMHLLLNMWALYVVGPSLEGLLGRARFSALYLLSALGGSVTVYLLAPLTTATAGASGAIFGLFGATLIVGRRLRMDVGWVVAVIVINLVFTFTIPRISWQGHLGGLITGLLVAFAYVYPAPAHRNRVQALVSIALLALFVALIWWRTAELVA
ncbi:rhomboid family intramembrane serine protease [Mycolicibacter sinensis]|uniref:Rhomboid family intramembrane serine protease n=1 Tax=Mycolicibacter sinensis (strain JDM601) TaxID=875328 RepID=A0A1A2EUS5_MYCSD|nr:rhomboid family intramembrane serine protease [Mycolicibacter sinensis]OBF98286.1 rhomboid family intramembrane serine protease [Mycolicibacter sinensis]OBG09243.1 rhomboid family intramembrane serine protease [Mycolicibacter sinensis]